MSKLLLKCPCDSILHVHFVHCLVFQLKHCARFEVLTVVVLKIQVLWLCQHFVGWVAAGVSRFHSTYISRVKQSKNKGLPALLCKDTYTTKLEISDHFDFVTVTILAQSKLSFLHWLTLVLVFGEYYTCQKFAMQLSLIFSIFIVTSQHTRILSDTCGCI